MFEQNWQPILGLEEEGGRQGQLELQTLLSNQKRSLVISSLDGRRLELLTLHTPKIEMFFRKSGLKSQCPFELLGNSANHASAHSYNVI